MKTRNRIEEMHSKVKAEIKDLEYRISCKNEVCNALEALLRADQDATPATPATPVPTQASCTPSAGSKGNRNPDNLTTRIKALLGEQGQSSVEQVTTGLIKKGGKAHRPTVSVTLSKMNSTGEAVRVAKGVYKLA